MSHPSELSLALLAGGDLGVWARWRVRLHLSGCESCRRELEQFEFSRERLRSAPEELPGDVNWAPLAAEMKANIHLGLAAGECVGPVVARSARRRWHKAVILAPVVVPVVALLLIGVWVGMPRPQGAKTAWVDGTLIEATSGGIELRQGDRMLSLRHPDAGDVTYAADAKGTVRAGYVDAETGQVTIHNVYAQ